MRAEHIGGPWPLALALSLGACTPKGTEQSQAEAERAPPAEEPESEREPAKTRREPAPKLEVPVEFEPAKPPAPLGGEPTKLSFDADPPPLWFDKPACRTRYARAETLDIELPASVDVDLARVHALREFSTHTLVWTPAAGERLVDAPAPGTGSRVRWRLQPGVPVELVVIDSDPEPEDAERCWDAVKVRGVVEFESADDSLAITAVPQFLQLTPTSTWVHLAGTIDDFGLAYREATEELDPSIELQIDLPAAEPRAAIPLRRDNRGLPPIELHLDLTVDRTMMIDGRERRGRAIEYLAVSEGSPEARDILR